jgi:hypothetical protein
MKNYIVRGNPELDFFDQNPEWLYITECIELIEREGRPRASRIMWSIYMIEDPESLFYRIPIDLRRGEVAKNYLKEPSFSWDNYKSQIAVYIYMAIPKDTRLWKQWEDKVDELTKYMTSLEFGTDDKVLLTIMTKSAAIWAALKAAKITVVEAAERESQIKGGGHISVREKKRNG